MGIEQHWSSLAAARKAGGAVAGTVAWDGQRTRVDEDREVGPSVQAIDRIWGLRSPSPLPKR